MFYGLVSVTWFDTITVTATFVAIVLVQVINAVWVTDQEREKLLINATITTTTTTATTATTTTASVVASDSNGRIHKQQSEQSENGSPASPTNSSPSSPVRTSIYCPSNSSNGSNGISSISFPHTPGLPDNLSDEYHEDEDTLSLENLFPCDQSEIYASKKINFIIDELIGTESSYIQNLRKGLQNYGSLQTRDDLPAALRGGERQQQLLGNIAEILELHERHVMPLMLRTQHDLKTMFDELATYFDKNQFYCYVTFTINKKTSMQLRQENREWFQNYQNEINDRLGIDSFLVQPVQRLTRYPLLLQQFIKEFYKSGINCKPVLVSVCKLETRMRRLLEVVNQAEEIPNIDELTPELNLEAVGPFRRSTEFEAYHHRSRKRYRAKVFLFDRCLLCAEVRKRRLAYRQHYAWPTLELQLNTSKSITLLLLQAGSGGGAGGAAGAPKEEYEFSAPEAISVSQWLRCARNIIERARTEAAQKGKLTLPMDLVLAVGLSIWLMWQYL